MDNIIKIPNRVIRIYSSWYRHTKVYNKNFISNGFPSIVEPLIFIGSIGLGLGQYVSNIGDSPYVRFLAICLPLCTAMFTAAFECSFGSFVRLKYNRIYDYMLAGPLLTDDIFIGEMIFAGTKGSLYSFIILCIFLIFNIIPISLTVIIVMPLLGFLTGISVATISLLYVSFIETINQINYYITCFVSPMFMFSGTMFPFENLPFVLQRLLEIFPLVHTVRLARSIFSPDPSFYLAIWDVGYVVLFTIVIGKLAIIRLNKKLMK